MVRFMSRLPVMPAVFILGGGCYVLLELLWRGRSHASMFVVGGICCMLLLALSRADGIPFAARCLLGGAVITAVEFAAGCVLNLWLGLNVWDYSALPAHFMGQVSLPYSALWCVLCAFALPLLRVAERVMPRA